ncbi:hypothetical protein BXZ70DRAFT_963418 [Cristinia sonorae]|uniref:FHA domain-containing protein n=1 Tax=Cristinia sonorae TaxID=1940300 RepID=A0A8K0UD03_9AGAR|nr:hypothetical protein BXZ70DRAFT_963418 [Cristinia sonorae]
MPPFASSPISQLPYPALYLYPLNDSFIPKHISLVNGQRVKIGRQTNAKTVPAERNGYFDSKVLSRQHAEVWEESGKIFIKDVKSSNGTFINGERLSAEGVESEPFDLKNEDIVEFGIDIVGEDNKTIVHHKVAARVLCIFNEQDAQTAARIEAQHSQNPPMYSLPGQGQGVGRNANAFNFAGANQAGGLNGVPGLQRGQVSRGVDLGGMGGNARQPMKGGITFQDLLSRLQGEVQKSRETTNELTTLNGTINDIHDTLGGNLPLNPPYSQQLPPVVPPQASHLDPHQMPMTVPSSVSQEPASALSELQAQLRQTQESLATHVEKIRTLEGMLAEHEAIKREVSSMRDMMEERKREMELLRIHSQSPNRLRRSHPHEDHSEADYSSDDDDARSIATIVPHELERVEEEDEEQIAAEEEEEERRRRREELGRPRTPEPTGMGMTEDDDEHEEEPHRDNTHLHPSSHPATSSNQPSTIVPDELIQRMTALASQLESALELSRSLETQHTNAQSTILSLEEKVSNLESLVKTTQAQVQAQAESQQQLVEVVENKFREQSSPPGVASERADDRELLKEMFGDWKTSVERQWGTVQEEWADERDRMRRAKEEVEVRLRTIEEGVSNSVSKMETGLATLVNLQSQFRPHPNGSAKTRSSGGLVTPPSPRSLSAASMRPRQRKRRSSSPSGRSRSRSASPLRSIDNVDEDLSTTSPSRDDLSPSTSRARRRLPWMTDDSASESEELHVNGGKMLTDSTLQKSLSTLQYPITPEPSLRDQPVTGLASSPSIVAKTEEKAAPRDVVCLHPVPGSWPSIDDVSQPQLHSVSTMAGVLILSVAAAAVIWRVKPEAAV